jgi:hypothetical protein
MAGEARTTTDHDEIRQWVEARGGRPARVKGTGSDGDPGILRIDFPDSPPDDDLEPISWEEWFRAFDDNGLAFLYQEETADGHVSRFNKLVKRETVGARGT